MSTPASAALDDLDALLASKIKEIIELHWRKHLGDIQSLSLGQFYERRVQNGMVSYHTTHRYILRVRFRYAPEARRATFMLD
jgi:hypothetical protein